MNPYTLRRIVVAVLALVVLLSVIWIVATFVYNGSINISGSDASLRVTITDSTGATVTNQSKENQYRLSPGLYRVVATTSKAGVSRLVQVKPLSGTTVKMGDATLLHASIALRAPLYGVIPYKNWFVGYEPTTQLMERFNGSGDSSNRLSSPAEVGHEGEWTPEISDKVAAYRPYNTQGALAISDEHIYSLGPGSVNEVDQTGIVLKDNAFNSYVIGANTNQDSFIIGFSRDVYWYQNAAAKAKKVYSNAKQFDQAAYGGDYAILYSTALPNSHDDLRSAFSDYQVDPQVLNVKTGQVYTLSGPVSTVTISPDGKYATVKPRDGQAYLYDLTTKKQVVNIDQPDGAAPFWTTPTTYIYEKNKIVWRYNIQSQESDEIAAVSHTITSFTNDGKGGYLASYYNGTTDAGIILISQTALPDAAVPVQQFLPYQGDSFSIDYSNVSGPTISITTTAILNNASQLPRFRADTRALRQQALDYLKSKGVDVTKFTIVYDPADPLP